MDEIQEQYIELLKRKEFLLRQQLYKDDLFRLANLSGFKDLGTFHRDLCKTLETTAHIKRRLFLIGRGHFKTTVITICNTVRKILINPNIRLLIVSSTLENVKNSIRVMKDIFWKNEAFRAVFPEYCPEPDTKEWGTQVAFTVPNRTDLTLREATVEAFGIDQTIVGRHYDEIIYTDIVTDGNVTTPAQIQKVKDAVAYAVSILDNPATGGIDMEGTRYDFSDIYGMWEELAEHDHKNYLVYKRPAEYVDDNGERKSLFFEKFTIDNLDNIKKQQGSFIYASQYLLSPIDEERAPFKRNQIVYMPRANFPNPKRDNNYKGDGYPRFVTVDPAISESDRADYSVVTTAFCDENNMMYIEDIQYGRMSPDKLIKLLFRTYEQYNPMTMGVESQVYQKLLSILLLELGQEKNIILPIQDFVRGSRSTKKLRIMSLQPRFEQHKIVFADDLDHDFIESQILRYDPLKKSNKDDLLDTIADLEQIKIIPEGLKDNEYRKYPMKRFIEWLNEPGETREESYSEVTKNDNDEFIDNGYHTFM